MMLLYQVSHLLLDLLIIFVERSPMMINDAKGGTLLLRNETLYETVNATALGKTALQAVLSKCMDQRCVTFDKLHPNANINSQEISGFYGGVYENGCRILPMFQKCSLSPSSGR
jgi:hypothetical protein